MRGKQKFAPFLFGNLKLNFDIVNNFKTAQATTQSREAEMRLQYVDRSLFNIFTV